MAFIYSQYFGVVFFSIFVVDNIVEGCDYVIMRDETIYRL